MPGLIPAPAAAVPVAPDGLPLLDSGRHRDPSEGACFMEFASLLAGEPFSDHPRCTHPLLGLLARTVNDNVDEVTRQRLLPLVPQVVGMTGDGPALTARVVAAVTAAALILATGQRPGWLIRAHARARRRAAARGWPSRCWLAISETVYRHGPARHAVARSVTAVHGGGAAALCELLADTVSAVRDAARPPGADGQSARRFGPVGSAVRPVP
jgi:hypothetical protein